MGHLKKNYSQSTALLAGRDNQALGGGDKIIQTLLNGTTYKKQKLSKVSAWYLLYTQLEINLIKLTG